VRSAAARAGRGRSASTADERGPRLLQRLGWSPRDAVGFLVGASATLAILINVLFMQSGSHPAPMFKGAPVAAKPLAVTSSIPAAVPRPRPAEPTAPAVPAAAATARTPGEVINDIQRELARRGYYEGPVDGLYGPRTDVAIREFEQAAGMKPSSEPNEALLQAIVRSPAKLAKAVARPPLPVRNDPAAERPTPSKRVMALQRALADFGYGQIKPSGVVDAETKSAIEKFERERKLPPTGQPSDRVMREMTDMTGRQFD